MPVIARISFAGSPRVPFALAGNFMPQSALAFSSTALRTCLLFTRDHFITIIMTLDSPVGYDNLSHSFLPVFIGLILLRSQVGPLSIDVSVGDLPETHHVSLPFFTAASGRSLLNLSSLLPWDSSCHHESTPTPFTTMSPTLCRIIHFITTLFILSSLLSCELVRISVAGNTWRKFRSSLSAALIASVLHLRFSDSLAPIWQPLTVVHTNVGNDTSRLSSRAVDLASSRNERPLEHAHQVLGTFPSCGAYLQRNVVVLKPISQSVQCLRRRQGCLEPTHRRDPFVLIITDVSSSLSNHA
ncbi:hypothetical protein L210DRAFT_2266609 [Boletus edulis BED1]|uniref:Uncharacterized protein n=1 Tax=Boletus edulis BED1 TaxID=1328754 RepID=A0AAD4GDU3_BOLED|nr:hypothetical protein L210DRAFT_2266609 [Boletus edulis BED1]